MALIIRSICKTHELCLRASYKSLKSAIKYNGTQMTQINHEKSWFNHNYQCSILDYRVVTLFYNNNPRG